MRVELSEVAMSGTKVVDGVTAVVEQSGLAWHDFVVM